MAFQHFWNKNYKLSWKDTKSKSVLTSSVWAMHEMRAKKSIQWSFPIPHHYNCNNMRNPFNSFIIILKRAFKNEKQIKLLIGLKCNKYFWFPQMSCFDRDHRVVVQRGNSSGSIASKNGPSAAAPAPPIAVRPSGSGVTSVPTTPRASRTIHTNSTVKLKNLKERLSEEDGGDISPEQKQELEIGENLIFWIEHNLFVSQHVFFTWLMCVCFKQKHLNK